MYITDVDKLEIINQTIFEDNIVPGADGAFNTIHQEFKVTDRIPIKEGFEFIGWNTKEDGSGMTLNPGDAYDRSEGFDLYAIYKEKESPKEEKPVEQSTDNPKTYDNFMKQMVSLILCVLGIIMGIRYNKYTKNIES
ncbi:MAG: hypothetical protein IJ772_01505 [Bacilli bacterium]|nr:hypothetical protein [Bacilli bacterium]MBR1817501.1 hypothetical protein [Bacilli bacterium]